MLHNIFSKSIRISYGITVCNEATELTTLLSTLIPLISRKDEIIVLQDVTRRHKLVDDVLEKYKKHITVVETLLNNDFATFKNTLIKKASGDYLFQIDADEVPKATLIKKLKSILRKHKESDCFFVPRINIVNGYTAAHIDKWKWEINDKNYINFPDYQPRIIKLNGLIKWENKVHEVFKGYTNGFKLPIQNDDLCLIHIKDIKRQESQNEFYDTLS